MFKVLYNECIIRFNLSAKSPLLIRSGEKQELDPTLPDDQFIRSMYNGEKVVVMPGSSIKGVFRSRAEKLLAESCNVFDKKCFNNAKRLDKAKEIYKTICPACRLFGNMKLKGRIQFKDAYPIEGSVKMGTRYNVGIDRVSGSAKGGALFEPEVLEQGTFEVEILLRNVFKWQIKTVLSIIEDINKGFVVFGGVTTRGFGKMEADDFKILVRDYGTSSEESFYSEKEFSFTEINEILKNVTLTNADLRKVEYDADEKIL